MDLQNIALGLGSACSSGALGGISALKHFGHSAVCVPMPTIDDVFREVEAKAVKYGVVPIENSTEGVVHHTLDNFRSSELKISGEVELRIHQHLLVKPDTEPSRITRIYSHQQSLAQWPWFSPVTEYVELSRHYPGRREASASLYSIRLDNTFSQRHA